jgi:hypothetical protein
VQPDAHRQGHWGAVGSWCCGEALAQSESGQDGPLSVIFLGQWGTKHRQEAIARHLLDRPAILLDLSLDKSIEGAHLAMQILNIHRRLTCQSHHQGATEECDELALTLGYALDREILGGGSRRRGQRRPVSDISYVRRP